MKGLSTGQARAMALVVAASGALMAVEIAAQQPAPSFRSGAEIVRLEVSVNRGDAPLDGLTPADFEIRDNGVVQRVLSATPVRGAHVIVAIDVSGSVEGDVLAQEKEAVLEVLSRLAPDDRASVVAFADRVTVLARVSTEAALLGSVVAPLRAGGGTALHDALVVAASLAREDERPAVVLLFTDGGDSSSWASARRALDHLRRHGAVVFPIVPASASLADQRRRGTDSIVDPLTHSFWLAPGPGDTERLLDAVARLSGGQVVTARASTRLLETFAEVLGRYRQRYVLAFEPTGVSQGDGWHRLDVKVPRQRASVTARAGYWAGVR
jgi:VWFA-related protein